MIDKYKISTRELLVPSTDTGALESDCGHYFIKKYVRTINYPLHQEALDVFADCLAVVSGKSVEEIKKVMWDENVWVYININLGPKLLHVNNQQLNLILENL